jgi:hypothetical protein
VDVRSEGGSTGAGFLSGPGCFYDNILDKKPILGYNFGIELRILSLTSK